VRFDILKGKSEDYVAKMLDAAHRAIVDSFDVPQRDRFQIVSEHEAKNIRVQDAGLGIERTDDVVIVSVTSRPRSEEAKVRFYKALCDELKSACGIAASDVVVSFTINSDADWSFGHGRAQFLTGEL
jgi:hypothetical protein